jgi:hypothetical protein
VLQLIDGARLVAGRSMRADDLEAAAGADDLFHGAVFRMRDYRMFGGEGHATRVELGPDKWFGAGSQSIEVYPAGVVHVRVAGSHWSRWPSFEVDIANTEVLGRPHELPEA